MSRRLLALAALAMLWAFPAAAQDDNYEHIRSFHSDITVYPDGSMLVRETIRVRALGERIERGIYRDFPTLYRTEWLLRSKVGFELLEVQRDGRPEPHFTEPLDNGLRIYIGEESRYLRPGDYTYTIVYRTTRQLGFLENHDELYWNVTGNGWAFRIEEATATVHLPAGIPPDRISVEAYTGPQGATERNYAAEVNTDGVAGFRTTAPLDSYEGLTIVVGWPKGFVAEPTAAMKRGYLLEDNPELPVGLLCFVLVLAYYLAAWVKVGRDPAPGTIVTLYEPPEGYSPAALRYVTRMGFDDKAFTASVLNLAVKGYLTIREEDNVYTLARAGSPADKLAMEERKAAEALFRSAKTLKLKQENHSELRAAIEALKAPLHLKLEKVYFLTNRRYLIPGLALSALVLVAMIAFGPVVNLIAAVFMSIWLTGWSFGVFMLLRAALAAWVGAIRGRSVLNLIGAIFISAFSIPFVAGELFGLYGLASVSSVLVVAFLLAFIVVAVVFHYLLKAPTRAGRALLDKIDGFKEFLTAVEGDRLQRMGGPEITPEIFEKFLPYAVALDVEQAWAEKFSSSLAAAGQTPAEGRYSPRWYSGTSWSTLGATGFASSMGSSFSGAISSASTAPGSSSGSSGGGGGGGSSGGGGGGGGGGGW